MIKMKNGELELQDEEDEENEEVSYGTDQL